MLHCTVLHVKPTVRIGRVHQKHERSPQLSLICCPVQGSVAHLVVFVVVNVCASFNQKLGTLYGAVVSGNMLCRRHTVAARDRSEGMHQTWYAGG